MAKRSTAVQAPNTMIDTCLLILLYAELILIGVTLSYDVHMLMVFCVAIVGVAIAVWIVKGSFYYGGKLFSKYALCHLGDPLRKKTTMKKWCDQSWQLAIHVSMSIYEYIILQDETWWTETETMWNGQPGQHCRLPLFKYKVQVFYIVQLAIWIYTAFSCKYIEEVRKDYVVMMTHHVITIALVAGSYVPQLLPIGVCVLFLHDVSDVPLDILKMSNYVKLEGAKGLFISEIAFVIVFIEWFYIRVYTYPVKLLKSSIFEAKAICSPNTSIFDVGDDIPYWLVLNSLLILLWLLHIWWGFLIIRLLIGILSKGSHAAAEDEYEGVSSDSEADKSKRD